MDNVQQGSTLYCLQIKWKRMGKEGAANMNTEKNNVCTNLRKCTLKEEILSGKMRGIYEMVNSLLRSRFLGFMNSELYYT